MPRPFRDGANAPGIGNMGEQQVQQACTAFFAEIPRRAAPLLLFLAAACAAPTQTIQESRDLSTSGLAYTETVDALVSATIDQEYEINTTMLIKARRGQPRERLQEMLEQNNEAVLGFVEALEEFRGQNRLLSAYFLNLQALADSPVSEEVGGAVAALSGSIAGFNQSQGGSEGLSPEQQADIGRLAGLVAGSVQAGKLKSAFARDAEVIATQLALHEQQLGNIAEILSDRFGAENDLFYNEKVRDPFVDSEGFERLPGDWRDDRKHYLKSSFYHEQLLAAQMAARQLRGVWTDIVNGGNDIGSLRMLMADIDAFVEVAGSLKDSAPGD